MQENRNYHHLTRSLKKLGRYIGRGNHRSIASAAMSNNSLRPELLQKLGQVVRNDEVKRVCSDQHDSILKLKSKPALECFSWETVCKELSQNTPMLMSLLSNLIPPSKQASESVKPALCMCASIILKLNNQKINLVQSVVSLILKAGQATKQVKHSFDCSLEFCSWLGHFFPYRHFPVSTR